MSRKAKVAAPYTIRLVDGITASHFSIERGGLPPAIAWVWLPQFQPERQRGMDERRQLAETIVRLLNGELP